MGEASTSQETSRIIAECHQRLRRDKQGLFPAAAAAAAKSLQSCPTLCDPIDSSPPGTLECYWKSDFHRNLAEV